MKSCILIERKFNMKNVFKNILLFHSNKSRLKDKKNQDKLIENDLWSSEIINMQTQKNCESPKIETVSITHQFDKKYIK